MAQVHGRGLAGLVQAQLGLPLDKGLQCSAWSRRPLSQDQIQYAAADAAVLLLLLDSFIAAAFPKVALESGSESESHDRHDNPARGCRCAEHLACGAASPGVSQAGAADDMTRKGGAELSSGRAVPHGLQPVCSTAPSGPADTASLLHDMQRLRMENTESLTHPDDFAVFEDSRQRSALTAPFKASRASSGSAASPSAVHRAAEAWGGRLEVGGGRAACLGRRKDRQHRKLTPTTEPSSEADDFGEPFRCVSFITFHSSVWPPRWP
jgi:hypothetical protein